VIVRTVLTSLIPLGTQLDDLVRGGLCVLLMLGVLARVVRANNSRASAELANRRRATHDALTDLPNRELLSETVTAWGERAIGVEMSRLTRNMTFLATTASACPFIGLFGTVWGIMQSFRAIGQTGSTSIAAVAPGISGALVNTAAGLAAAIPAMIFYNYFMGKVREQRAGMEDFSLEFINLAERNFT